MATRDRMTPEEEDFLSTTDFSSEMTEISGLEETLEHRTHSWHPPAPWRYRSSGSIFVRLLLEAEEKARIASMSCDNCSRSSKLLTKPWDYDIELYTSPTPIPFPNPQISSEDIVAMSAKDKRTFTGDKNAVAQVLGINLKSDTPLAHNKTTNNKKYHQERHRK